MTDQTARQDSAATPDPGMSLCGHDDELRKLDDFFAKMSREGAVLLLSGEAAHASARIGIRSPARNAARRVDGGLGIGVR
ncbi:hypothetical protein [Streptomyces sp. NPDC001530]|uniref:hypothetical protein n=1 Tax=Streptomyces sp. NPDC001530 TaxID=3364582 RepID=UPI0036C05907